MANKTTFLELTQPENGEFVDNWHSPLNNNFELIDDHLVALRNDLVGTTGVTTTLKGSKTDMGARLDVGLNADGTLKLDTATDYTVLESSKAYGVSASGDQITRIVQRFEEPEKEIVGLRLGENEDRYGATGATSIGPSMVRGVAKLGAMYQNNIPDAIQCPVRGFTPNSIIDGPFTFSPLFQPLHITFSATEITFNVGSIGLFYNIDGIPFHIYGDVVLDMSGAGHGPLADSTYYLWISRNATDYNTGSNPVWYKTYHGQPLGGPFKLETRILPTHASLRANAATWSGPGNAYSLDPTDGVVTLGGSTLDSASAGFTTYGVRVGDILVITSPSTLAGEYVIGATGTNTQFTITGEFRASSSAVTFHVERRSYPAIGFNTTQAAAAGRVYIGEFVVSGGGGNVTAVTPYAYNGIYDAGWAVLNTYSVPTPRPHYLGVPPSQVEVWLRDASGNNWRDPTVIVDVQHVDEVGQTTWGIRTLTQPAFKIRTTATDFVVIPTNPLNDTTKAIYDDVAAAYVDLASVAYSMRIILRR